VLAEEIDRAAQLIAGETRWSLYDPQLERFIEPKADREAVAGAFEYGREQLRRLSGPD
jgi:hypothetical protein